jgi:hypothetical protein
MKTTKSVIITLCILLQALLGWVLFIAAIAGNEWAAFGLVFAMVSAISINAFLRWDSGEK